MAKETVENNVQGVCIECVTDAMKNFNNNLPDVQPGDLVKACFMTGLDSYDGPMTESMWVEVTEVKGDSYVGTLENTPFFIPKTKLRLGDYVEVKHSQCWGYLKKPE